MSNACGRFSRRGVLRLGSVGGLSLAEALRWQQATAAETPAAAKKDVNCIFIFLLGGMPHQDLWDLKPDAPAEIRGDFQPISTAVPGLQVSDCLPGVAQVTDKLAILRGMTHTDSDHGRGFHIMMTGVQATGPGDFNGNKNNNQHPSLGSMVSRAGGTKSSLPPYISVPNFIDSGGPSFLGASHAPFVIESDPASPEFSVRDITLPADVTDQRSRRRQAALRHINDFEKRVSEASKQVQSLDTFYEKAYRLMVSQEAKEAFDIHREPATVRERYGNTSLGQCCLLARRLVEAGCRFVTIENGHWDTHRKNTESLRQLLVPAFDRALPALLVDLAQSGLLDSTLVVVSTEFGRTPRINELAGRDHWPGAFSVCLAGAGLKTGQAVGATDKHAAYVTDRPTTPADLAATILSVLGIDPQTTLYTPLGRPVPLVNGGKTIHEVI
ncbi:MAG TPA: DUF1501 domain-containing protein [Pirellulales bacterium]|nr:DUF1501 domain-containing protein [Pirellulales bacterium]